MNYNSYIQNSLVSPKLTPCSLFRARARVENTAPETEHNPSARVVWVSGVSRVVDLTEPSTVLLPPHYGSTTNTEMDPINTSSKRVVWQPRHN